jgi:hypothetical protein
MYRSLWYRAVVALWGLWITTALVEPAGLLTCAMHGGRIAPPSPSADAAATRSTGATGHVHHAGEPTAPRAEDEDASPPGGHACCTCVGHCCVPVPVAAPPTAVALVAPTRQHVSRPGRAQAGRPESARDHALPFANGPPVVGG